MTDGAVEDTTTNNEHLRVSMGCNSDSQDRLDGESRTKVLRSDDTTRTLMGQEPLVFRAHWHHEAPSGFVHITLSQSTCSESSYPRGVQ